MTPEQTASRLDTMLDDLQALVEVESPSLDQDALATSAHTVAALLEKRLGGEARLLSSERGPHVLWSAGGEPTVLLLGHHDTVFPLGTLAQRPFMVKDGHATGPGVFDMLGGLVQGIHAIASLEDHSGVEFLITADEEVGSGTSRALVEERARACGAVLVLEGAAPGGAVKTERKGCGTFEVIIEGKASHAGLEPEAGVNALVEAAHQVQQMAALSRPEAGTTVTPTVAQAGTQSNVVPARAVLAVDVRVTTSDEQERVEAGFAALTPHLTGASIQLEGGIHRPPMPESSSGGLYEIARRLQPGLECLAVGGGSDGNFTAALGIPTLDGLGAIGGGAHADHEYLEVDAMEGRVKLVAGLIDAVRNGELTAQAESTLT